MLLAGFAAGVAAAGFAAGVAAATVAAAGLVLRVLRVAMVVYPLVAAGFIAHQPPLWGSPPQYASGICQYTP